MWHDGPQHTKSLVWKKMSTNGQGEDHPKSVRFFREQEEVGEKGNGKGKKRAKDSLDVLSIVEVPEMSTFSSESINFPCYSGDKTVSMFVTLERLPVSLEINYYKWQINYIIHYNIIYNI